MPSRTTNYVKIGVLCTALLCLCIFFVNGPGQTSALYAQDVDAEAEEESNTVDLETLAKSTPLLKEPKTPEEQIDAVLLMLDLARPQLAKLYLDRLVESKPNDAAILKLRDKHGPALFLRLNEIKTLQPASGALLKRVNDIFRKQGADSKRIDALVDDLGGSPVEKHAAITALRSAGAVVVPRMLQKYAAVPEGEDREEIIQAFASIGKPAIPPLIAAVNCPNQSMKTAAIDALGWIRSRQGVHALWYPAFVPDGDPGIKIAAQMALIRILEADKEDVKKVTPSGVANELKRVALLHFNRKYKWKTDIAANDNSVTLWSWDAKKNAVASTKVTPDVASKYTGAIYARQAFILLPNNRELQALYIGMMLDLEAIQGKLELEYPTGPGTAFNAALSAGADVISETLQQAMNNHRPEVAIAALQLLGQISSRHQLFRTQSDQSPIIAALNYPDSRVQFTAAVTVLQLDPNRKFRGSTRVVTILTRTLMDDGSPAAVVIHPDVQQSSSIAAFLQQKGFNARTARTGREGFLLATKRDDVELILVDANVARWGLSQTIANLRADSRTAYIPIAIFGPEHLKLKMDNLIRHYPLIGFMDKPTSSKQLDLGLNPILAAFKTPTPTPAQRVAKVDAAAYWLAHIANSKRADVFDISSAEEALIKQLSDPVLFDNCLRALSQIPTKSTQTMFQQIVINADQAADAREQAALNLAFHIQRFGLLLNDEQVAKLQIIWKNSSAGPKILTAIATVIGSLKPDNARVGKRLKQIVPPVQSLRSEESK